MVLTEKLWRFFERLNRREIDWALLYSADLTTEERDKAVGMLVKRGFVESFDADDFHHVRGLWRVICGKNVNPVYGGKRLDFTAEKYAKDYRAYLYSSEKVSGDCSVVKA